MVSIIVVICHSNIRVLITEKLPVTIRASVKVIRWLAGYTFSLYILRQPLWQSYAALIDGEPAGHVFYAEVVFAAVLTIRLISAITEPEHMRHHLKAQIRKALMAVMATGWWRRGIAASLAPKRTGEMQ